MMAPLIVLLGIDGAGKSTAAEEVARLLRAEHDMRVAVCWARWQPGLLASVRTIAKRLLLRKTDYLHGKEEPPDVSRLKASAFGRWWFLGILYVFAALVDYRLQYAATLAGARRCNDLVLLDRYWYDLVIDAVGNSTDARLSAASLVRWPWSRLLPSPSRVVLLDIDERIALERKGHENPLSYLARRRSIYRDVAAAVNARTVDAGRQLADVARDIAEIILSEPSGRITHA